MTSTPFLALNFFRAFFRHDTVPLRIANTRPALALPAEVTCARLARYPGASGRTVKSSP